MERSAEAAREFWRDVLVAGGSAPVPRWTLDPVPGVAVHEAALPDGLVSALRDRSHEAGVPLSSVLLAAHARVLAALSGERDVVTGYVASPGGAALPCRLPTGAGTWRSLVETAGRVESALLAHRDFPLDRLQAELALAAPAFEAVFDPEGAAEDLPDAAVLRLAFPAGRALRLQYRTEAIDGPAAARIAGYHLTALRQLAADPTAEPHRQTLLSADELRFQVDGLAGPHRKLPDLRVHELFEQRVAEQPDAVAAVHGERQWTYRELNSRANRLGRALLARGLGREDVVAVVTERNLDWMAAVLAAYKSGLVYLPLEPHFPAARMTSALTRARCRVVVTERGSDTTLAEALAQLPGVERLFVDELYEEGHDDADLDVSVGADQLAYVLFTSGSTGEPKGVMCEHAGLLNHLFAKIDDLGLREGDVVPQTGPQCFDISIWQMVAGVVLGGRTLLVEQDVILDVERLVDTLVLHRAAVLQAVPSYLDVVLAYLEQHPRDLPDLRCVSPTGDLLKRELVERWFATEPDIPLVNTYGLTETSDDAVHERMDRVPESDRVPLGRPINNVRVYVVDEDLVPVPLGAPGLIAFSGVCVGRGYMNDPERTARVFLRDPHRPGERLLSTGDYGRWLPDGKLDFLGRRDNQVKIRGFRIEIGEIENALLRVAGVRDAAVVVADDATGGKRLVAFCSGAQEVDAGVLRAGIAERVPDYMLPSDFHWLEALPLTANGKVDRTAMTRLAGELAAPADVLAPSTPAERRLAAVWAPLLGVEEGRIGRHDHFFERGGTSLSAVKLAIALERKVSLAEIVRHPVLADLAGLLESRSQPLDLPRPPGPAGGERVGPASAPAGATR